jgi:hypothetical protein
VKTLLSLIPNLSADIHFLIAFWQTIYKDGKYIKREAFTGGTEHEYPSSVIPRNSNDLVQFTVSPYTSTIQQHPAAASSSQTWHANSSAGYATMQSKQSIRTNPSQRNAQRSTSAAQNKNVDKQLKNCLRRRQLILILVVSS